MTNLNLVFYLSDNARNWRDVKEQQQQTNSEQSPHTNSKTWPRSSSHEKEGNSNLPEWCNDDSFDDAVPGSFDSSGQYRSFKEVLFLLLFYLWHVLQ